MIVLFLLAGTALAAGYYHPADVAAESQAYARASEHAGSRFEELSGTAEAVAAALREREEALDLLGDRIPEGARSRHAELERNYNRDFARLEKFANYMVEDFDGVFLAALERARQAVDPQAEECMARVPLGPSMPGIPQRYQDNPECTGENLNARLAGVMDADPILRAELDEILALEWPEIRVPAEPQPIIGDGSRYVRVLPLFQQGAGEALRAITRADDKARIPFQAAIEEGASKQELASLTTEAKAVTARTAAARAELAEPVLEAATSAMNKWAKKGEPMTGWCANPPLLGGCQGMDKTIDLLPRLLADRKLSKALP